MLIPNSLVYRARNGATRLGGTWLDVPNVSAMDAPVVLERIGGLRHLEQYRSFGGRLWEMQYTTSYIRQPADQMKIAIRHGLPALHQRVPAEIVSSRELTGGLDWHEEDEFDEDPRMLATPQYRRLIAAAKDRLLVDGVLHRATPGPLVTMLRKDVWTTCDLVDTYSRKSGAMMSVEHHVDGMAVSDGIALVQHGEKPSMVDLLPMNLEAASWYAIGRTHKLRISTLDKRIVAAMAELRRIVESRRPELVVNYLQAMNFCMPVDGEATTWPFLDEAIEPLGVLIRAFPFEEGERMDLERVLERARERLELIAPLADLAI